MTAAHDDWLRCRQAAAPRISTASTAPVRPRIGIIRRPAGKSRSGTPGYVAARCPGCAARPGCTVELSRLKSLAVMSKWQHCGPGSLVQKWRRLQSGFAVWRFCGKCHLAVFGPDGRVRGRTAGPREFAFSVDLYVRSRPPHDPNAPPPPEPTAPFSHAGANSSTFQPTTPMGAQTSQRPYSPSPACPNQPHHNQPNTTPVSTRPCQRQRSQGKRSVPRAAASTHPRPCTPKAAPAPPRRIQANPKSPSPCPADAHPERRAATCTAPFKRRSDTAADVQGQPKKRQPRVQWTSPLPTQRDLSTCCVYVAQPWEDREAEWTHWGTKGQCDVCARVLDIKLGRLDGDHGLQGRRLPWKWEQMPEHSKGGRWVPTVACVFSMERWVCFDCRCGQQPPTSSSSSASL